MGKVIKKIRLSAYDNDNLTSLIIYYEYFL